MNLERSFIDKIEDWAVALIHTQIYLTPVLFLGLEELGIPMPVPGDFVIAYTGYEVMKGSISYPVAFILLLLAILLGSSGLYFFSKKYGESILLKYGEYIHLDKKKLDYVADKFRKYGMLVIIIGRHIPGFRIPVTVFAGISHISYKKFLISEFISVIIWIYLSLSVGEKLGAKTLAAFRTNHWLYFIAAIPIMFVFLGYITAIVGKNKKSKYKK